MNTDPAVLDAYYDEAKKIGFTDGFVIQPGGPTFVYVADDPDQAWAEIGKYVLYEAQTYASFQTPGSTFVARCARRDGRRPEKVAAVPGGYARRRARGAASAARDGGRSLQPAGGRNPARARLAEPRAVRRRRCCRAFGDGSATRAQTAYCSTLEIRRTVRISLHAEVRNGSLPSLRRDRIRLDGYGCAESRARRCAAPARRPQIGDERARDRARRHRRRTRYAWVDGVRDALRAVHEVWTRHIVETEAPGAFLDEVVAEAPRLATPASRLRREHNEILAVDHARREATRSPARRRRLVRTRGSTTCAPSSPACSIALARHRQRGADLVYEAYDVDIGGGF